MAHWNRKIVDIGITILIEIWSYHSNIAVCTIEIIIPRKCRIINVDCAILLHHCNKSLIGIATIIISIHRPVLHGDWRIVHISKNPAITYSRISIYLRWKLNIVGIKVCWWAIIIAYEPKVTSRAYGVNQRYILRRIIVSNVTIIIYITYQSSILWIIVIDVAWGIRLLHD